MCRNRRHMYTMNCFGDIYVYNVFWHILYLYAFTFPPPPISFNDLKLWLKMLLLGMHVKDPSDAVFNLFERKAKFSKN